MLNLKHELLKLEKAIQQQGEDTKRKSNSNRDSFNGSTTPLYPALKEYLNSKIIKLFQPLSLRNSCIPKYITIDTATLINLSTERGDKGYMLSKLTEFKKSDSARKVEDAFPER